MAVERRQSMLDLENKVQQNTLEVKELHDLLMGPLPTRTNGINGALKKLREDVDAAVEWGHDIWNVKRRTECISIPVIKSLDERITALEKGGVEMGVAKVNLTGVYVMGVLQFLALVAVALIGRL